MSIIYKSIAYAFPTSNNANFLGCKNGCWYVQLHRAETGTPWIAHNCEGYEQPNHPDLIAFFNETEGSIDPSFRLYGNALALRALNII